MNGGAKKPDTTLLNKTSTVCLETRQGRSHYYRMDLLSRAVTAFSPSYRAGTTIPGLKVEPSVPGHRAGIKEGPLVLVGNTNRD